MDWNALAHAWITHEHPIERAHAPVREGLLARAALRPGERVLDIGCGSGASALEAARMVGAEGTVTAFDLCEAFVARVAERGAEHGAEHGAATPLPVPVWGDAQTHDFTGFECDVAISLFGVMFFDDPVAAFANIATALRPGGRIVFVCWAGPQHNPWFSVPGMALKEALPDMPPPDPSAPGPMAFADSAKVTTLLSEAGFGEIHAEAVDTHLTPVGAAADVTAMMLAVGPFRGAVAQFAAEGQEGAAIDAIAAMMTEGYGAFAAEQGLRVPARVSYTSATRPG